MTLTVVTTRLYLLTLALLLHFLAHAGCADNPRGWEAAHLADRQAPPLRFHPVPKRAPLPASARPHPSEVWAATAPAQTPRDDRAWTVSLHVGWLLALAAACAATGYGAHVWQSSMQLALSFSTPRATPSPALPGPDFQAASEELRLKGREVAAAIEASADSPAEAPTDASVADPHCSVAGGDSGRTGCGNATAAAEATAGALAADTLVGTGGADSHRADSEDGGQGGVTNGGDAGPASAEDARRLRAAAAAAAFLTGDALFSDSSPDEPGGCQSTSGAVSPGVPALLALGAAAEPGYRTPEGPRFCGARNVADVRDKSTALSTPTPDALEPIANEHPRAWSEGGAGPALQAPRAAGLWEEAAGLVATLAARFGVAPGELAAGERVALVGVVLQTWAALQQDANAREAAWQRERANELRATAAAAAVAAAETKARQAAAEAAGRQLQRFRAALGDGLPFGVAVMLGAAGAGAARLGLLAPLLRRCRPLAALGPLTPARPWALLEAAGVAACWAGAVGDLALAAASLLGAGWAVARTGLLAEHPHGRPLVRIGLGLGVGAGGAGFFAVSRVGGDAPAWLAAWEAWLCLHLLAAWAAPGALALLEQPPGRKQLGWGVASAASLAAYHVAMAVMLPFLVGVAPFRGRLEPVDLLSAGLRRLLRF